MAIAQDHNAAANVPRSQHVNDASLKPFLARNFSPADYFNLTLPSLSSNTRSTSAVSRSGSVTELNSQLQTLLSQLNGHTARLSETLTTLTDDIIRCGGRLAYEVEVLQGEANNLSDSLKNELRRDIEALTAGQGGVDGTDTVGEGAGDDYLTRLRQLNLIRSRLDSVIKVFGDAMSWPIAPSELSIASSLISVSAPGDGTDTRSQEEKGKEYAEKLRRELNELMGSGDDVVSLDAATARVNELRNLAKVWKGTAEEKARLRFVESVAKPIEEHRKVLEKNTNGRRPGGLPSRPVDYRYGDGDAVRADGSYGFLQNLRNLKSEVYLE